MISVICISNKPEILNQYLIPSLKQQSEEYELILIDNQQNEFLSASSALNDGIQKAHGELIVFVHQDVVLEDKDCLIKTRNALEQLGSKVFLGAAGASHDGSVLTNIIQGKDKKNAGIRLSEDIQQVQTLDEVYFAGWRQTFIEHPFDEKIIKGWHLYAVDQSLSLSSLGYTICVLPLKIYHLSTGKLNVDYVYSFFKVFLKHRKKHAQISTTCTSTRTDWLRAIRYMIRLYWDHVVVGR